MMRSGKTYEETSTRRSMADEPVRVMGLSGSIGATSANQRLLTLALRAAEQAGAETVRWDLEENPLPLVGAADSWEDENVKAFQEMAKGVDAFIVSSPEYHGSMSSVIKNQFDWLYFEHVEGKTFGLMSTLGGQTNSNTLNHLRLVVRWLRAWVVPTQVAVGKVKSAFDEDGELEDEELASRVEKLAQEVIDHAIRMRD